MASTRGVAWSCWVLTAVFVTRAATATTAGPMERELRADPLSALEGHDLIDLLDHDLDDRFLVPKMMLQDRGAPRVDDARNARETDNGKQRDTRQNMKKKKQTEHVHGHTQRNLQASPAPSPALLTAAPTEGEFSRGGISSSYSDFSFSTDSPSAAPSAAPTVGSGIRGDLYGSASPTAAPTAAGNVDDDEDSEDAREVASASGWGRGADRSGIKSAWAAAVAAFMAGAVLEILS